MDNLLSNIQIVLCDTSHTGNIGSAARAMKTMGLMNLTLVNPLNQPDAHSRALACNASDVVDSARVIANLDLAIANSHLVIAMTGRKREFSDRLLTPKEIIPEIFENAKNNQSIAIVFGNEQHGLTIEQQEKCNRLVTIPGNPQYFSLNLAQAVQIMCYEIYSNYKPNLEHLITPIQKANHGDTQYLLNSLDQIMLTINYYQNKNADRVMRRLQKILHKADLEREETDLLHGIFNKIKLSITRS